MIRQAKGFNAPWRETYLDAAARFRLPYWDPIMPRWDKDASPNSDQTKIWGCPRIFLQRQVYVRTPGDPNTLGEPGNKIQNPLYSFKFPTESDRHSLKTVRRRLKFPPAYVTVRFFRLFIDFKQIQRELYRASPLKRGRQSEDQQTAR